MEVVKAMIHDQDLPMHLWAEAGRTTVHVQNKSPHKVLRNKTLEEMFSWEKPEVSHLRIFGYPVYIHVPKEKKTKLEPSGRKGIFVGYSRSSKAFNVYIPGFKQIETSQDVTFDEDAAFSRSRRNHAEEVLEEEPEAPRVIVRDDEEHDLADHDMAEPQRLVDPPKEAFVKRKPTWDRELI